MALERLEAAANGDLLYTFTRAWSDGTRGITLAPLELLEKLAALVPSPRVHQVRVGGCLAAPSKLRGAITPTPRQQGSEKEASPASSRWGWARLLKRVFALDMARCPRCHQGTVRLIAAITSRPIIRRILHHLKLAADLPPIAPARVEQARFAWASASTTRGDRVCGSPPGPRCVRSVRHGGPHRDTRHSEVMVRGGRGTM